MTLKERIDTIAGAVCKESPGAPEAAIILGTGLGGITGRIGDATEIAYDQIPGMPNSTVVGHAGRLVCGTLGAKRVVGSNQAAHYI